MKKTNDNFMHIVSAMAKVQECPWNPFKLNEIVTLEKCLQELSLQDPRIKLIIRNLASECSIVEPSRKLHHLSRSKQEEHEDGELKRCAMNMSEQIATINYEIDFYRTKFDELIRSEAEMRHDILQTKKSIIAVDNIYKLLFNDFGLLLERVYNSFVDSLTLIKTKIPEHFAKIGSSKFLKQIEKLPDKYRRFLLRLVKANGIINCEQHTDDDLIQQQQNQQQQQQQQVAFKRIAANHLNEHMKVLVNLYRDLALIDQLYLIEVPVELDRLKVIEARVNYLERPVKESPKRVTYIHQDLYEIQSERLSSAAAHIEDLQHVEQTDPMEDPELNQMLALIPKLCKPYTIGNAASS